MGNLSMTRLEVHVTHACNLACESCSHFSNQDLVRASQWISAAEINDQMALWSSRLEVATLNLLGGEPTLNPTLSDIVHVANKHWPKATKKIITNGAFLHRHPALLRALLDTQTNLAISKHVTNATEEEDFKRLEETLEAWRRAGVQIEIYSDVNWSRRYRGVGNAMVPIASGNPDESWEHCPARHCHQLHLGAIWKCAMIAFFHLHREKYPNSSVEWEPMMDYRPLLASATDEEIARWVEEKAVRQCGLCPGDPEKFTKLSVKRR